MTSWLQLPANTDFTLQNIPFGVGRCRSTQHISIYTRLGDSLISLSKLQAAGHFHDLPQTCLQQHSLNLFMSLGRPAWQNTRRSIQQLLSDSTGPLARDEKLQSAVITDMVR